MKFAHVFFGALPNGCGFWHKDGWWVKTDEEEAFSVELQRRKVFEVHLGCVIAHSLAVVLNIPEDSYRREQPPTDDAYTEKLLGIPLAAT